MTTKGDQLAADDSDNVSDPEPASLGLHNKDVPGGREMEKPTELNNSPDPDPSWLPINSEDSHTADDPETAEDSGTPEDSDIGRDPDSSLLSVYSDEVSSRTDGVSRPECEPTIVTFHSDDTSRPPDLENRND